ncbi:16S rRNA (cytidine(1402)-2'-O)-methyltransferase [Hydrogenovibrio halophilus]|uniref:16S rRNA (cytidine(1402)-2'-O)-methyltransferase n=1 Tax=Hydrogenovibrio halophilus TaxID=373391 RepID=UPI0003614416|nr:16S rRNA (cytidine(1402)-2'-O)-methyltransferase [Hydrogenovibrio halophilus]
MSSNILSDPDLTVSLRVQGPDNPTESGCLYVIATPIGHLEDLSARATRLLDEVDWIAAEDTRHSQTLLQALGLKTPLISLHEHNEAARTQTLLPRLQAGEVGALISDAGTPLINDPGYTLVRSLRQANVPVVPVPGPSAVIAALSAAGLPTDRFAYEGFLPAKAGKRQQALKALLRETRTLVFYESPHRLLASLQAMAECFPERELVVAKELTKRFEAFVSGLSPEVHQWFCDHPETVRGEFVLMLSGADSKRSEAEDGCDLEALIDAMLAQGLPVKQIAEILTLATEHKKKALYQWVQTRKDRA